MAQKRIAPISVLLTGITLLTSNTLFAQGNANAAQRIRDSLKVVYLEKAAIKNPIIRQASIAGEYISSISVKTNLQGKEFYNGDMQILRSRANLTIPIVGWGSNKISASTAFLIQQMHFSNASKTQNDQEIIKRDTTFSKSTMKLTVGYTRMDKLFGIPVVYGLGVAGLIDQETGKNYLTYTGLISFQMIRNQTTSLMLGMVVNKDPYALLPAIPLISYSHMFKGLGIELFVELPRRIAVQKELTRKSWLTLGTELGSNPLFFSLRSEILPRNAINTTFEVKSGITYEYRLSKKAILGINGGIFTLASSKLVKVNRVNSTITSDINRSSAPYANLSLSFLPFW
jgi:hypothetical protein